MAKSWKRFSRCASKSLSWDLNSDYASFYEGDTGIPNFRLGVANKLEGNLKTCQCWVLWYCQEILITVQLAGPQYHLSHCQAVPAVLSLLILFFKNITMLISIRLSSDSPFTLLGKQYVFYYFPNNDYWDLTIISHCTNKSLMLCISAPWDRREEGTNVVEVWINASIGSIKGVCVFHDEVKPFVIKQLKIWTTVS